MRVNHNLLACFIVAVFSSFSRALAAILCLSCPMVSWRKTCTVCWLCDLFSWGWIHLLEWINPLPTIQLDITHYVVWYRRTQNTYTPAISAVSSSAYQWSWHSPHPSSWVPQTSASVPRYPLYTGVSHAETPAIARPMLPSAEHSVHVCPLGSEHVLCMCVCVCITRDSEGRRRRKPLI